MVLPRDHTTFQAAIFGNACAASCLLSQKMEVYTDEPSKATPFLGVNTEPVCGRTSKTWTLSSCPGACCGVVKSMVRGEALRFWRSKCDFFDMARCHRAVGSVVLVICLEINENIVRGFSGSHTMLSVRKLAGSQGWLGQLTAQKCRFRGVQQRELDQDPHFCHPRAPSEAALLAEGLLLYYKV